MNYLSLFSGIGGMDLGLDMAGMTCVGQVEIDPYCRRVLAKHWPEVSRHDDVRTTCDWWASVDRAGVDLIVGGFPCQPFSNAGFMRGVSDERWMWPAMASVVRELRPRYVLVENVAALVRDGHAFGIVLSDLAELGFDAEWSVLSASDFGAPHRRERVYLLAHPTGVDGITRDLLEQSGIRPASFPAGGLSGLEAHQRRRAAGEWMAREPRLDRLANGIPNQVERLRVAGNAVVPQVAEHVGRLIMAADSEAAA